MARPHRQNATNTSPSPAGEGRGEGKRAIHSGTNELPDTIAARSRTANLKLALSFAEDEDRIGTVFVNGSVLTFDTWIVFHRFLLCTAACARQGQGTRVIGFRAGEVKRCSFR
ncbi:hypothetical protein SBV1_410048 [Verrucomicrobia bacterium]|nr:hypothetical protein SBV1_410048 [Verrucomicrobiota bacterium]